MTHSPLGWHIVEDEGLAAVLNRSGRQRDVLLSNAAVLGAAQDALQSQLSQRYLDPFAPAAERNAEVVTVLRAQIAAHRQYGGPLAIVPTDEPLLLDLFAATLGWGPAQRYLDDPRINEVKIIGRTILVQEAGRPFVPAPEAFGSSREVRNRATQLASLLGVRLDANTPQATLPLAHGTRMHVSIHPRVMEEDGALICIRRGRSTAWDLDDLLARGTLDEPVLALLQLLVGARCSFLIAGRTGSGKTGMLEALANSWPGSPHIVSIEDHTAELVIRRASLWTREMVNTQRDEREGVRGQNSEFGRVAIEALRQTPDLLVPGEVRRNEAGAILSLLLSDHPVITTIHARSCREAVERFAACAALPGSYMYEGRRADALRDAAQGFDVVVKVDVWEEVGRRVLVELALLDGMATDGGAERPALITLAQVAVSEEGQLTWEVAALPDGNGGLRWLDGRERTPERLREKLRRARAMARVLAASTSLEVVQAALERAEQLLLGGDGARALATLAGAWRERQDERLVTLAQRALAYDQRRASAAEAQGRSQLDALLAAMRAKSWPDAQLLLEALRADLPLLASVHVPQGWDGLAKQIRAGLEHERGAATACEQAGIALSDDQPRRALDLLAGFRAADLSAGRALELLRLRESALEALSARGEATPEALESARAQREGVEALLGRTSVGTSQA